MKTDSQLQHDVMEELGWEASVNAAQIGVSVKDGIASLSGDVGSFGEKWDAESAAQRVGGVKGLAVDIRVTLPGSDKRNDADIAQAVENVLQWTSLLPLDSVKVLVENGWVTLAGEVDWDYQRRSATRAVRYLMGVTGVSDQIALKPAVSLSVVKDDIEAALRRRAKDDAKDITVQVSGTDVILSGTSHSWAESELARNAAWSAPGVRQVVNNITVTH
ncbi:BON domain-containing protein [Rhodoferax sp. U11-2br]|uniref:BON domain-containing protein n=1 Tax=Rhodoferax sp. U11-2br TaxID=2838878 RepID=UPI001BE787D8|nr:BON domain-containing protein [Rhodoferax sp. U11-2br]MBT3067526.1 BON domain-containing protein [Rhodoferax sp. U11-2br]